MNNPIAQTPCVYCQCEDAECVACSVLIVPMPMGLPEETIVLGVYTCQNPDCGRDFRVQYDEAMAHLFKDWYYSTMVEIQEPTDKTVH